MQSVEITYRYKPGFAPERAPPPDAAAALHRLGSGSRTFAALLAGLSQQEGVARQIIQVDPRDLGLLDAKESTPSQRPYAAVLGCSDARVPVELIFNEGPNDLFVVRVAGNGLGADALGSLKYAVEHLADSVRLIVVLGHSGCGAVTAAVDAFLSPSQYLAVATTYSVRTILDRVLIVVHASAKRMALILGPDVASLPGYRAALIEVSIVAHAALGAHTIERELTGGLHAVYGVYRLDSHEIWSPGRDGADGGLAAPPAEARAFIDFFDAAIGSPRIRSILDSGAAAPPHGPHP